MEDSMGIRKRGKRGRMGLYHTLGWGRGRPTGGGGLMELSD